ncbi:MAG: PH domain-containing protein [Phycisphaerae bacterium]
MGKTQWTDGPVAGVLERGKEHGAAPEPSALGGSGPTPLTAKSDGGAGGLEGDLPARTRIISPSLLLPAEIVVFELKPSLWYVALVSAPIAAAGLALIVLAYAIQGMGELYRLALIIGVWVAGLGIVIGFLQWLGRTYVLTDRRILKQRGVINVRVEYVGLERIENSFVAQAAFQRLVGIGTLFFRCDAARAGTETHTWEHVRRPKEVHAHIVAQIDRWKQARARMEER